LPVFRNVQSLAGTEVVQGCLHSAPVAGAHATRGHALVSSRSRKKQSVHELCFVVGVTHNGRACLDVQTVSCMLPVATRKLRRVLVITLAYSRHVSVCSETALTFTESVSFASLPRADRVVLHCPPPVLRKHAGSAATLSTAGAAESRRLLLRKHAYDIIYSTLPENAWRLMLGHLVSQQPPCRSIGVVYRASAATVSMVGTT
jgi:hypothetical protein